MAVYRERIAATDALWTRWHEFNARPFPTDWAKRVNGVGLVSLTMRAQRMIGELVWLTENRYYRLSELQARGEPDATAVRVHAELNGLVREFDRSLPALPTAPQSYFADLRLIVADAVVLARRWTTVEDPAGSPSTA